MASLFAARDAGGQTRFVGDVPRGSACGCFCPVCASPLVAKQGDELEWHFAHEAGTERPECRTGGINLLRRLAAEELKRRGLVLLPYFATPHPLAGRSAIEWTAHPAGEVELHECRGPHTPCGSFPLREGGVARLFICIDRETPPAPSGPQEAMLILSCPYPADGQIRTEAQARQFVAASMRLHWQALPDFSGRVAAAREEARQFMDRLQRERADQAGARWAATRRAMQQTPRERMQPSPPEHPATRAPAVAVPGAAVAPAWAPGLVAGTSIHYRALDDGSQWVCFQCGPGQWRLAPVPEPQEGWDESWPPSVAVPEGSAWLRVVDFGKLLAIFNAHAKASGIDSDPSVIESRFLRP